MRALFDFLDKTTEKMAKGLTYYYYYYYYAIIHISWQAVKKKIYRFLLLSSLPNWKFNKVSSSVMAKNKKGEKL